MTFEGTGRSAVMVSLLGGFRVATPAAALEGGAVGRRAQIAFARLALDAGQPVSRELLADAVWGERVPASWRPALRNVVADLRRGLETAGLDEHVSVASSQGGYRLSLTPDAAVDLVLLRKATQEAERAARSGNHRLAAELAERSLAGVWREPLPGGYEEWVVGVRLEAGELRDRLERVAGEAALKLGDPARGEHLARRLVGRSPLREDGHRLLIEALRASGNRAQAVMAYDRCRRMLAEELGVSPSPDTQQLLLEMLSEASEEKPAPAPGRRSVASRRLLRLRRAGPYVGRDHVLEHLSRRLALVESAGMVVVCLSGEAGLGKTRLAAELAGRASEAGAAVLYGRADDRLGLPYAALLDAIDGDASGPDGEAAQAQAARYAVARALRTVASRGRALVVLDDMHWASRAELEILETMLADPEEVPLLVLVLHRSPQDAAVTALGGGPRIERLALEGLSVAETRQLMTAIRPDATGDGEQLWRLSGGNPLLASELLRSSLTDSPDERPVALEQLVRERLARLPAGVEEALRVAAVAGLEFDRELVVAASPGPGDRVRELLDAAERDGLLGSGAGGPGTLAFRHALVRDALLGALDPAQQLRLHARLGSALEREPAPNPSGLVNLAYHFAAAGPAGDWRRALRYAHPAARTAFAAGVYEDVIALASRTIATLGQEGDPDPEARLDLEVLLGGAQRALGDPHAERTLTQAFEEATSRGDAARAADAALAFSHTGSMSDEMFLDDRYLPVYERALEAQPPEDLRRRALLLSRIASAYAWRQSTAASSLTAGRATALAQELGEPQTLAAVLTAARRAMASSHDLEQRERCEGELLELADRLDDPGLRVNARLWRFGTSVLQGRGEELEELLRAAGEHARGLRMSSFHHSIAYERASLALLRGRVAAADVLVERAAAIARGHGLTAIPAEAIRLAQLLLVRHEQGRLAELREDLAATFAPSGIAAWVGVVAYVDVVTGHPDGAGERLDAMIGEYAERGPTSICSPGLLAFMASAVVKLGDPSRASRLRDLLVPAAGQGGYVAGFSGPIDFHLGVLDRFLGGRSAAQERFAAAQRFCAGLGAPSWEARCWAARESLAEGWLGGR